MVCVYCNKKIAVINSRFQKKQNKVWRRRKCLNCGALFTTNESIDLSKVIMIKRPDGQLEAFSREKLLASIYESCKHRKTPEKDAESLTASIITRLLATTTEPSIDLLALTTLSTEVLKNFDKATLSYYRAYYC